MVRIQLQFVVSAYVASDPSLMPQIEIIRKDSQNADMEVKEEGEGQKGFQNEVSEKNRILIEALSGEYALIVLKESNIETLIP